VLGSEVPTWTDIAQFLHTLSTSFSVCPNTDTLHLPPPLALSFSVIIKTETLPFPVGTDGN
jgi:hypothetical protein